MSSNPNGAIIKHVDFSSSNTGKNGWYLSHSNCNTNLNTNWPHVVNLENVDTYLSVLHIWSHIQNMCFTQIFPKRKFSIELKNLLSTYLKYMIQIWIPFKSVLKICICFQIWCRHKYFNMWSICIKICVTFCLWQKSANFSGDVTPHLTWTKSTYCS